MNILVTGCNGQLGNELKSIYDLGKSDIGVLPEDCLNNSNVFYYDIDNLDITDIKKVRKEVKDNNIDIIINCAAYTNVDACEENKDLAMKVNSLGAKILAIAANDFDAKLVHVSTDYVFAGNANTPYTEYDITNPQSVYGKTKNLGEEFIKKFCSKYFILRTAWLYGLVGNNFVKTMLKLAKNNSTLKVVNDQRGNPTNTADLAYHIVKLSNTDNYGTYHCTCKGECTWFDFANKIFEFANIKNVNVIPCTTDEFPRLAKRPAYSHLDNMMLRCTIGDDTRKWEDALYKYIKDLKEKGEL